MDKEQPYIPVTQADGAYSAPQGYPPQDYPPVQGYPPQDYPPVQGYPPPAQGYTQPYPVQGYPPDAYNASYGIPPPNAYAPQPTVIVGHGGHVVHCHVDTHLIRAKRNRGVFLIFLGILFIALGIGLSVGLTVASGGTWTVVWYGLPIVGIIEIGIGASHLVQAKRLEAQLRAQGGHV